MTSTPETIDLLIEARWVAPVDTGALLENHAVAVQEGKIIALLPAAEAVSRYRAKAHFLLDEHLLIPGLINLHTHAAMSLMRGLADDLPLQTWLQDHIWPAEARNLSSQFVLDGTRLACAEMLRGGITCFSDMYFFPDAAATAATEAGMRVALGLTLLEFASAYGSDADDYISKGLACRERWLAHPNVHFCLAPHAPYTVSDRSFQRIGVLAEQLGLPIHCHIHETRQEIHDSLARHGLRPLQRLQGLGLLNPGFIGVHGVHLDERDIALLAENDCALAHCPTSNLKLGSGIAPVARLLEAGITVGLGTDGAASNNRLDMFQEMRLASLLAKGSTEDASQLPAATALRMATLNAARALGLESRTGSITPGKDADLCAVHLGEHQCRPCFNPLSQLVHVAGREQVTHTWVAGKCCVEDKQLQTVDARTLESALALWQNVMQVCR